MKSQFGRNRRRRSMAGMVAAAALVAAVPAAAQAEPSPGPVIIVTPKPVSPTVVTPHVSSGPSAPVGAPAAAPPPRSAPVAAPAAAPASNGFPAAQDAGGGRVNKAWRGDVSSRASLARDLLRSIDTDDGVVGTFGSSSSLASFQLLQLGPEVAESLAGLLGAVSFFGEDLPAVVVRAFASNMQRSLTCNAAKKAGADDGNPYCQQ